MKKMLSLLCVAALALTLLAGCGESASEPTDSASQSTSTSSEAASDSQATSEETPADDTAEEAAVDTEKLASIVASLEEVNPVPNPMALDSTDENSVFVLENDLKLTMDNIAGCQGHVTNTQADCALVLAVQAKPGMADTVKGELEAYKESLASNTLYVEFADKVAKAQDARIVVSGDFVVMVIAGVSGPDYAEIDAAIESALA